MMMSVVLADRGFAVSFVLTIKFLVGTIWVPGKETAKRIALER